MIQPPLLKRGDTVAIVSTARKIDVEDIQEAIDLLKSWGLRVRIGSTIGMVDRQFAGTDQERLNDFQAQLDDPDVAAIWCARGGYGSVRLVDYLNFDEFLKHPKWVVGFSDPTVLHSHIHNLGVCTLHAAMPITVGNGTQEAVSSIYDVLFDGRLNYEVPTGDLSRFGKNSGILVGGNLSILYSLLGSVSAIDTKDKILFIEDLDEYLYHIDRMMMNLKRNGYFKDLKGLIVGGMTKMNDNTVPFGKTAEEIIIDVVGEYDFPVCFQFPAGHLDDNRALLLGSRVSLEVRKDVTRVQFLAN